MAYFFYHIAQVSQCHISYVILNILNKRGLKILPRWTPFDISIGSDMSCLHLTLDWNNRKKILQYYKFSHKYQLSEV